MTQYTGGACCPPNPPAAVEDAAECSTRNDPVSLQQQRGSGGGLKLGLSKKACDGQVHGATIHGLQCLQRMADHSPNGSGNAGHASRQKPQQGRRGQLHGNRDRRGSRRHGLQVRHQLAPLHHWETVWPERHERQQLGGLAQALGRRATVRLQENVVKRRQAGFQRRRGGRPRPRRRRRLATAGGGPAGRAATAGGGPAGRAVGGGRKALQCELDQRGAEADEHGLRRRAPREEKPAQTGQHDQQADAGHRLFRCQFVRVDRVDAAAVIGDPGRGLQNVVEPGFELLFLRRQAFHIGDGLCIHGMMQENGHRECVVAHRVLFAKQKQAPVFLNHVLEQVRRRHAAQWPNLVVDLGCLDQCFRQDRFPVRVLPQRFQVVWGGGRFELRELGVFFAVAVGRLRHLVIESGQNLDGLQGLCAEVRLFQPLHVGKSRNADNIAHNVPQNAAPISISNVIVRLNFSHGVVVVQYVLSRWQVAQGGRCFHERVHFYAIE
eukprot:scaffold2164_cov132-Ochromonas_danica.AAC.2